MAAPSIEATRDYLHEHIPLSAAMGVEVVQADASGVVLRAPLEPNLNHRATGFGGSVSALGILAGWTLLHVSVRTAVPRGNIVIQHSEVEYIRPVRGPMEARCLPPSDEDWQRLLDALGRKRKGRVRLGSRIEAGGELCALFRGQYAVLD